MNPTIPPEWTEYSLSYRYHKSTYTIVVENPERVSRGVLWVELDGRRLPTQYLLLRDDDASHKVRVRLGDIKRNLKVVNADKKGSESQAVRVSSY